MHGISVATISGQILYNTLHMVNTPYYPEDEYLPIFDPENGTIVNVALRKRAHEE